MKLRYKFLDESVWQRLNQAISVGAYIEDACIFAGISSRTLLIMELGRLLHGCSKENIQRSMVVKKLSTL